MVPSSVCFGAGVEGGLRAGVMVGRDYKVR